MGVELGTKYLALIAQRFIKGGTTIMVIGVAASMDLRGIKGRSWGITRPRKIGERYREECL